MTTRTLALMITIWILSPWAKTGAEILYNDFDYNSADTTLLGGLGPGNFTNSFGGLNPTAGTQFFFCGNGNTTTIFYDRGVQKNLGYNIQDASYTVKLNVAWYNSGQHGGVSLSDFDELYIGSANGTMTWISTPEPIIEDQWYTWEGIFTPSALDIGQQWMFHAIFDLPPKRDIALDFPSTGFATLIPEPSGILLFGIGGILVNRSRRRKQAQHTRLL